MTMRQAVYKMTVRQAPEFLLSWLGRVLVHTSFCEDREVTYSGASQALVTFWELGTSARPSLSVETQCAHGCQDAEKALISTRLSQVQWCWHLWINSSLLWELLQTLGSWWVAVSLSASQLTPDSASLGQERFLPFTYTADCMTDWDLSGSISRVDGCFIFKRIQNHSRWMS